MPLILSSSLATGVLTCSAAVAAYESPEASSAGEDSLVTVRTIDPDDEDFSDLMPLRELIGDARVIALGEQSHGDGACFAAKHRLVRFLHQEMGFDVLAWESGMFDCRLMHEALAGGKAVDEAWRLGLFPIFGESAQVRDVLEYVASTQGSERPMELAGFDCQFSNMAGMERMPGYGREFFDRADPAILAEAHPDAMAAIQLLVVGSMQEGGDELEERLDAARAQVEALLKSFDTHIDAMKRSHSRREIAFARRVLENLIEFDRSRRQTKTNTAADTNIRDQQMGRNIAWLAQERYPDRKIIVWAASFHLLRNANDLAIARPGLSYESTVPMGHVARELLADDWYAVMFTAYEGEAGNPFHGAHPLPAAPEGSLEGLLHERGEPFVFIDLRTLEADHPFAKPIVARPLGYTSMTPRVNWSHHFDAVFHTDVMFPSTREVALPKAWRTAAAAEVDSDEPRAKAARLLEDARRAVLTFDLGFDSVLPTAPYRKPDASAIEMVGEGQWPQVLGHVASDPASFTLVPGDVETGVVANSSGRLAFTSPVLVRAAIDNYATLLCMDGVGEDARLRLNSYATFFCQGDMAGSVDVRSYATALIAGNLSGELSSSSYFAMVVEGDVSGSLDLNSRAMVYVLGSVTGDIALRDAKVAIAGRMTKSEVESRISGKGVVYLQDTDLPDGEHHLGELLVQAGVRVSPD